MVKSTKNRSTLELLIFWKMGALMTGKIGFEDPSIDSIAGCRSCSVFFQVASYHVVCNDNIWILFGLDVTLYLGHFKVTGSNEVQLHNVEPLRLGGGVGQMG